jgi:hypothetical protein
LSSSLTAVLARSIWSSTSNMISVNCLTSW